MPKVSVIIPVYNVEKYLPKCLDSVLAQTLKDIEIICVNDGSPDNSLAIMKEYAEKDKRIKIINQKNQGLSCSRHNALTVTQGEYVAFLDSEKKKYYNLYAGGPQSLYNGFTAADKKKYKTQLQKFLDKVALKEKTTYKFLNFIPLILIEEQ